MRACQFLKILHHHRNSEIQVSRTTLVYTDASTIILLPSPPSPKTQTQTLQEDFFLFFQISFTSLNRILSEVERHIIVTTRFRKLDSIYFSVVIEPSWVILIHGFEGLAETCLEKKLLEKYIYYPPIKVHWPLNLALSHIS